MSSTQPTQSYDATYLQRLTEGELFYQRCSNDHAVFPPRPACPTCGSRDLTWTESSGKATIYSATTIAPRDDAPYTIAMLDVADGFRMMSRLDGDDATAAAIGDEVRIDIRPISDGSEPVPCCVLTNTEVSA